MEYILAFSILGNIAIPLVLTYLHQREKKDLHDRLMSRSPDEYVYNTEVEPTEAKALRDEFLADKMEKTELTAADQKRKEAAEAF